MLSILIFLTATIETFGQVVADFTADDTVGCTPFTVHFTNTGSSGPEFDYLWTFGAFGSSTDENPVFTFFSPGDIPVTFSITDRNTSESDEITKYINVTLTPNASLTIDSSNACVNGKVQFHVNSTIDSALWDFGDGTDSVSIGNYMFYAYNAHGSYDMQCITYRNLCSDTSNYTIVVDGPIAEFSIDPQDVCMRSPTEFTMNPVFDVSDYTWNFGDGTITPNINPVSHVYDTMGYVDMSLTVNGATGSCIIDKTVHIWEIVADFEFSDARCHLQPVLFMNTSIGNTSSNWDLGNGVHSTAANPTTVYSAGNYLVKLIIENDNNCIDSTEQEIVVHPLPDITITGDNTVCPGDEVTLEASGGDIISWSPPQEFDDPNSYTPMLTADSSSVYYAIVTDTATHCSNNDSIALAVQGGFIQGMISLFPTDTLLIIGDSVTVMLYDSLGRDLSFLWSPDVRINCTDCPNPTMQPFEATTYTLVVSDTNQCFQSETFEVAIELRGTEEYHIGVPDAFTPNDDNINDIIKVDGWGIMELIEFRIFNRWGTEVFFTNNLSDGWDGYYKDKLQNVDTYSYIIKARMWDDNVITRQGTFSLLR